MGFWLKASAYLSEEEEKKSYALSPRAYLTSDALKIKPNSVVHYYCVRFDF